MKLEHVALNVENAVETAKWYAEHLGMKIVRDSNESPYTHFLADSAGVSMIEFYSNPAAPIPDYGSMNPLVLHLAFMVDDIDTERQRLEAAGGSADGDTLTYPNGDQVAIVRDPWQVPVQLVKRTKPLL